MFTRLPVAQVLQIWNATAECCVDFFLYKFNEDNTQSHELGFFLMDFQIHILNQRWMRVFIHASTKTSPSVKQVKEKPPEPQH